MEQNTLDQKLTETVRKVLAVRKETQGDLVPVLDMSWASVNYRFRGRQAWKLRDLEAIAKHFGIEAADLLQGDDHAVLSVLGIKSPRQREREAV
jgi:hypothetical protein